MTYLGQTKIAINNVNTLKLITVTKLKLRHFSHFYNKFLAIQVERGLFGQEGDQKGTKSCIIWQKSPLRGKSPLKGTQFSTLMKFILTLSQISLMTLEKGSLGIMRSVDFWYFLISIKALVPGLYFLFFCPGVFCLDPAAGDLGDFCEAEGRGQFLPPILMIGVDVDGLFLPLF